MVLAVPSAGQDNSEPAAIQLLRCVSDANQAMRNRTQGSNLVLHVSQALTQAWAAVLSACSVISMSMLQILQVQVANRAAMVELQRGRVLLFVRTVRLEGISSGVQVQVVVVMLSRAHSVVLAASMLYKSAAL